MNYILEYNGTNLTSFLNYLERNKISISKLNKDKNNVYRFQMSPKDYKTLRKTNKVFKVNVVKYGGLKRIAELMLKRVGLLAGIVAIVIMVVVSSKFTLSLKVVGNKNIDQSEIKEALQNYGYKFGGINSCNLKDIEKYLLENVEGLSLVSVAKRGNVLVVNVVEKEKNKLSTEPFIAPYNMVVKSIKLISGTLNCGVNDVVKKGDVIVENYVINSLGERIKIAAQAEVVADVYFCGNVNVDKNTEKTIKTGNKLVFSNISFFKQNTPLYDNNYNFFDINITHNALSNNMFLPIYKNTVEIYELEKQIETIYIDDNLKEKYFNESKQKAFSIVPNNVTINNEINKFVETDDKYIFQTYLEGELKFTNEN